MVTLFSIVIMFERREQSYIKFELVNVDAPTAAAPTEAGVTNPDRVTLRGPDAVLDPPRPDAAEFPDLALNHLQLETPGLATRRVPSVELPRLEFAELERLRLRQEVLSPDAIRDDYFQPRSRDPWARFGQSIGQLTDALKRFQSNELQPAETVHPSLPVLVSRPAPGFEAYIEWMGEPKDRLVLSTPPIQALWGRDPVELDAPVSLLFTVNPDGRVVEVLNPMDDDLTTAIGIALSKYRFAPLVDADSNQQGTFQVIGVPGADQP